MPLTPIPCYSCQAGPTEAHKPDCPVRTRIAELELALRASPDPASFANMNLAFEELPDGPMLGVGGELGLGDGKMCGGVTIKSLVMDLPNLGYRPVLGFEFYTVQGRKVQPILFTTEQLGDYMSIKTLLNGAVNSSYRTAKEMESKRDK